MLEDASQRSGDILRKFMHRARAITSMSDYVVRRLLHRSVKLCFTKRGEGSGRILGRGVGKFLWNGKEWG